MSESPSSTYDAESHRIRPGKPLASRGCMPSPDPELDGLTVKRYHWLPWTDKQEITDGT